MTAPPFPAGRFEVLDRLGSGSSGEVFRVRDRGPGRVLALKLLLPRGIADPARLARAFHREFHVLATLRHPHLVAVHDHGVLEASEGEGAPGTVDAAWFTMELVAGRPIDEALSGADAATIARVADALLDALGSLHRRALIRGDVKAANILVGDDRSSDPPPVRSMDLGLVAVLAAAGGGSLPLAELEQVEPRAARDADALDGLFASGIVRRVVDAGCNVAGLLQHPSTADRPPDSPANPLAFSRLRAPYELASRLRKHCVQRRKDPTGGSRGTKPVAHRTRRRNEPVSHFAPSEWNPTSAPCRDLPSP